MLESDLLRFDGFSAQYDAGLAEDSDMKTFRKLILALSILCGVFLSATAPGEEFWGGPRNSWSVGYWYWCGRLTFFHQGPLKLHWRDFYGLWTLEKSGDVYGVGFRWTRPLEPGYEYHFRIFYEDLPDYIVVDGNKVWDIETGRTESVTKKHWVGSTVFRGTTVFFTYVPSKLGKGMIWSVKDASYRGREGRSERLSFGIKGDVWEVPPAMCERTRFSGKATPCYPQWKLPEGAELTTSPRLVRHFCPMEEGSVRAEIDLPLDADSVPYPTDDVILDVGTPWWNEWWEQPKTEPLRDYFVHYRINSFRHTARLAKLGAPAPFLLQHVLKVFTFDKDSREKELERCAKAINEFTQKHPEIRVSLFLGEVQGRLFEELFGLPEFASIGARPWDERHNIFPKLRTSMRIGAEWTRKLRSRLKRPEQVLIAHQTDIGLFPAAYHFKAGADLFVTKNIHRQNVETLIANARGAASAYGKLWEFEFDGWSGGLYTTYSPDEFEQIMHLSFAAGADIASAMEAPCTPNPGSRIDNEWGKRWFELCRFVRRHPRRGKQVVKIALMRGFGDVRYISYPLGWHWFPPCKRKPAPPTPYSDHNLVFDIFFPGFDELSRTCTGTPFGPVDMIPWDTPLEKLKRYSLVVFPCVNAMDDSQYENLRSYVAAGGTLVLALGQLRKEEPGIEWKKPRGMWRDDFADFIGVRVPTEDGQPVALTPGAAQTPIKLRIGDEWHRGRAFGAYRVERSGDCEVVAQTEEGQPVVVRRRLGSGEVYFYATESIGYISEQLNRKFISHLAERARIARLDPRSDWIEYTVQKKGDTFVFTFFNHGRLGIPSGIGKHRGKWKGSVEIVLSQLGIGDTQELKAYRFNPLDLRLVPLRADKRDLAIRLPLEIDRRLELVVGPSATCESDFYSR